MKNIERKFEKIGDVCRAVSRADQSGEKAELCGCVQCKTRAKVDMEAVQKEKGGYKKFVEKTPEHESYPEDNASRETVDKIATHLGWDGYGNSREFLADVRRGYEDIDDYIDDCVNGNDDYDDYPDDE